MTTILDTVRELALTVGWIYLVWCANQILKTYKAKTEAATEQVQWFKQRIAHTQTLINLYEQKIESLEKELSVARADLKHLGGERDFLFGKIQANPPSNNDDALLRLIPHTFDPYVGLRN